MSWVNKVFLLGNLTRDPVYRKTSTGKSKVEVSIAINETYSGSHVDNVCFVDLEMWERIAENCAAYCGRGDPVLIEGKMRQNKWHTADGHERSKIVVLVDNIQFMKERPKRDPEQMNDNINAEIPADLETEEPLPF